MVTSTSSTENTQRRSRAESRKDRRRRFRAKVFRHEFCHGGAEMGRYGEGSGFVAALGREAGPVALVFAAP